MEPFHGEHFGHREPLKQAVFEYIEVDRTRKHSYLGYFSPEQFELAKAAEPGVHQWWAGSGFVTTVLDAMVSAKRTNADPYRRVGEPNNVVASAAHRAGALIEPWLYSAAMSATEMPAIRTGFFIASRRNGSPSSWLRMTSSNVVVLLFI